MRITLFFLICFFVFGTSFVWSQKKEIVVVIDPGHGGYDPGHLSLNKSLATEKELNLKFSHYTNLVKGSLPITRTSWLLALVFAVVFLNILLLAYRPGLCLPEFCQPWRVILIGVISALFVVAICFILDHLVDKSKRALKESPKRKRMNSTFLP